MDLRIDEKGKYFTSRVSKDAVAAFVRTTEQVIVGYVHVRPGRRLKDELAEDNSRFLPVTEARVYGSDGTTPLYRTNLVLVSYSHIVSISPLDAMETETEFPWQSFMADEEAS